MDERITKLAEIIVNYSTRLQMGENIWIDCRGDAPLQLSREIARLALQKGAVAHFNLIDHGLQKIIINGSTDAQLRQLGDLHYGLMQQMQAYVAIRSDDNIYEQSDISIENLQRHSLIYNEKIHKHRVNKTKWVVLRYPTPGFAQLAGMSGESFQKFYFDVCTLDYSKMSKAMDVLVNLMQNTDKVRITGPGTDISFSIKGMPAIKCSGLRNIPDGEVFTAPIKHSVNGKISYNAPSLNKGKVFQNICLEFKDGKIVKANCQSLSDELNKIFDVDEGARYIGEFSLGLNPHINKPMLDILFDEKIYGSIHFTPGQAYETCDNGNKSELHWDLVLIQTPDFGGGEIYFDDVLIRKDGEFVLPELKKALSRKALI